MRRCGCNISVGMQTGSAFLTYSAAINLDTCTVYVERPAGVRAPRASRILAMPRNDTGTADILNNVLRCGVGRTGIIQLRWLGIDLVSGFLRPIRANGCECFCAEDFRGLENSRVGNCPDYPSQSLPR